MKALATDDSPSLGHRAISYNERSLWFLHQMAPESAAYNVVFTARICSNLRLAALQRALQSVVDRHPALRATYGLAEGAPCRRVHEAMPVSFLVIDASGESDEQLRQRVYEASRRPFDLVRGPLFRAELFRRAEDEHILLLTCHHIVIDLWSLMIVVEELLTLYAAGGELHVATLPPLTCDYDAFVEWQRAMIASPAGESHWKYWEHELAGPLPTLDLPTDRPRPPVQTFNGGTHGFRIDRSLVERLQAFSKANAVTLNMAVQAAFVVLLHRYSGQDDLVLGSYASGRDKSTFEQVVGDFVNALSLRSQIDDGSTFRDVLVQMRQRLAGAIQHGALPFSLLIERLQPKRDPARSPLFQVAFLLQKLQRLPELGAFFLPIETPVRIERAGMVLEPFPLPQQEGQFDLMAMLFVADGGVNCGFMYNRDLFDAATMRRMGDHFISVLERVCEAPDRPVKAVPLLTAADRQLELVEWNATSIPYRADRGIHQLVGEQVQKTPDALAVTFEDISWTYAELDRRANQIAHHLRRRGVGPDVLVGVCLERSRDIFSAILGILKAGGAYLPLDPNYPPDRIAWMLEDSRAPIVLTQRNVQPKLQGGSAELLCLDADWEVIAREPKDAPEPETTPDNLAYVIFTSGSTGKPKGVMVSHRSAVNLYANMDAQLAEDGTGVWLAVTSVCFDISGVELLWTLTRGYQVVIQGEGSSEHPADAPERDFSIPAQVRRHGITHLQCTPSLIKSLLFDRRGAEALRGLRRLILGGEALPVGLAEELLSLMSGKLVNMYGPTETTIYSTEYVVKELGPRVSIGRPTANTQVYIVDRFLNPTPIGVAGELLIGGLGVARGYLNRPELTAQRFIPDCFSSVPGRRLYRTGDLARFLPDGRIDFLGRMDNQVKVRGFRIELGEIEKTLCKHPQVREAVVAAVDDAHGEKRLVAYVVPKEGNPPRAAALRDALRSSLPEFMVPQQFVQMEALPLTPNGKVDRKALKPPRDAEGAASDHVPPRDAVEMVLTRMWERILNVSSLGVTESFFDRGGHSLLAARLMAEISTQFGKDLPLSTLVRAPTIESLAALLRRSAASGEESSLVPIQVGDKGKPVFFVHPAGGNVLCYMELARTLGNSQPFYGLQSPGLNGGDCISGIEALGRHYLRSIREVQPKGPYVLGGWCFGGVIAYEMARQLSSEGEKVERLALLDSPAPDLAMPVPDEAEVDAWFLRDAVGLSNDEVAEATRQLAALSASERPGYCLGRLRQANVIPPEAGEAQVRRLLEVYRRNMQSFFVYRPGSYSGEARFFRATEESTALYRDPTSRWAALSSSQIEVVDVAGSHFSMMAKPHVIALGHALRSYLAS